ncbi:MAG: ABC transporter substrate-binding protein [Actinomycetota bacterium]
MEGDEAPRGEELTEGLADPRAPWEELVEDPAAPRAMLAVMFTDIVGSTELATALGDKRWRELLEQHDAAIRTQIARFDGREVDTAGDAFFATFGLAVRAVDCALESARAVRRLGLRIRAGIHMGECVVTQEKVRGVTVHIGARVGAKARGDEVLVSSTVRDILAGAGLKFADRGEQTLKGVDGKWRLYAVEPRVRDNEADLPPLLETEIAGPPKPAWQKPRVLAAIVTALAVLIGAIAFATFRGGGLSSVPADSVAAIAASSGDVESSVTVRRRPVGLVAAPDGVWVANSIDRSVTHIGKDGRIETIPVGPGPIAVASGTVGRGEPFIWVANADGRNVSRVSPRTGATVGAPIQAGNGLSGIGFGSGTLWLTNSVEGTVWRVDPTTGKRTQEIPVGPGLRGIAVTDTAVWVTSETAGTVTQIDPKSGNVIKVVEVGNGPGAVAVGEGSVWVANAYDGTVSRIDQRTREVVGTIRVGRGPRSIAVARGSVFVANEAGESVTMIDAKSGEVRREIGLTNAPMGLAADGDRVWVSVRGGIARYRGGTLRIGTADAMNSFDPTFVSTALSFAVAVVLYDGLTSFKRVGGPEGNQLVPNLVEELRRPTDNGTTYSYTLREGLKYSDGSAVKASDVRSSFERIIRNEQYGGAFLDVLKGADACTPSGCDLSAGIVTNDDARTIAFHLVRSYPEFPYTLGLPSLSILPATAPAEDGGATPIPGTGPYRIAKGELKLGKEGFAESGTLTLERNPHFVARGLAQPDAYADRIEITMGGDPEQYLEGVKDGRYDLTPDLQIPTALDQTDEIAAEFPSQLHVIDVPSTLFVMLNPTTPPFDKVEVRRALNFAVDRRAMIGDRTSTLEVSCQLLPENMIGYKPHCPYTKNPSESGVWTAPDLETARRLVDQSGTKGQRVTVWLMAGDSPPAQARRRNAPVIVDALRKIGYRADAQVIPGDEEGYFEELEAGLASKRQILLAGWITDYPGPANYFLPITTCNDTLEGLAQTDLTFTHYCDPTRELDRLILQAIDVQTDDPAAAAKIWAQVDQKVTDAAPLVNWANIRNPYFVSKRVGNVQGHPTYLVLLSQMWVVDEGSPSPTPGG